MKTHEQKVAELSAASAGLKARRETEFARIDEAIATHKAANPAGDSVKIRPLRARYATPPPKPDLIWLETAHFMPEDGVTVLLAWPRKEGFTFRTGRFNAGKWRLSSDNEPREKPVFYAYLG